MIGLETNTLGDNSRQVAQDLIKTTTTWASLSNLLKGKKGLVTGVANSNSIAYGAARAFHEAGAEIMLTCGHPKTEQYVRPLLCELGNPAFLLCDVQRGTSASGFRAHRQEMGQAGLLVPFHHIRAKGGLARPRGGLFARGLQDRHGDFLLLVHPDGKAGRTADEGWRLFAHHDLLWC